MFPTIQHFSKVVANNCQITNPSLPRLVTSRVYECGTQAQQYKSRSSEVIGSEYHPLTSLLTGKWSYLSALLTTLMYLYGIGRYWSRIYFDIGPLFFIEAMDLMIDFRKYTPYYWISNMPLFLNPIVKLIKHLDWKTSGRKQSIKSSIWDEL